MIATPKSLMPENLKRSFQARFADVVAYAAGCGRTLTGAVG